jgi:hypothetical protein
MVAATARRRLGNDMARGRYALRVAAAQSFICSLTALFEVIMFHLIRRSWALHRSNPYGAND